MPPKPCFQQIPQWVAPCLPTLTDNVPAGPEWSYEIKWDGYRVSAYLDDGMVTIRSRTGADWTKRFPRIAAELATLPVDTAVLDGEVVVLNEDEISDFGALQAALSVDGRPVVNARLMAFDLLHLDGLDVSARSLVERRNLLANILPAIFRTVRMSEEVIGRAPVIFAAARRHQIEGIVAKRRDAPYRPGHNRDWVKTKCVPSDTFAIVGYTASATRLRTLYLAEKRGGSWTAVGSVAAGSSSDNARLKQQLDTLAIADPAVPGLRCKTAVWVEPEVRVEVSYRERTRLGTLREACLKGTRED